MSRRKKDNTSDKAEKTSPKGITKIQNPGTIGTVMRFGAFDDQEEPTDELVSYFSNFLPEQLEQFFDAYARERDLSDSEKEMALESMRGVIDSEGLAKLTASLSPEEQDKIYNVAFEGAEATPEEKRRKNAERTAKARAKRKKAAFDSLIDSVPRKLTKAVDLYVEGLGDVDDGRKANLREWFVKESKSLSAEERAELEDHLAQAIAIEAADAAAAQDTARLEKMKRRAALLDDAAQAIFSGVYDNLTGAKKNNVKAKPVESQDDDVVGDQVATPDGEELGQERDLEEQEVSAELEIDQPVAEESDEPEVSAEPEIDQPVAETSEEIPEEEISPTDEGDDYESEELTDDVDPDEPTLEQMQRELRRDTWLESDRGKYKSETVDEAARRVNGILDKLNVPKTTRVKIEEGVAPEVAKRLLDALAETLEQEGMSPTYLGHLDAIVIKEPQQAVVLDADGEPVKDKNGEPILVEPISDEDLSAALGKPFGKSLLLAEREALVNPARVAAARSAIRQGVAQEIGGKLLQTMARHNIEKQMRESDEGNIDDAAMQERLGAELGLLRERLRASPEFFDRFKQAIARNMANKTWQEKMVGQENEIRQKWEEQITDRVRSQLRAMHDYRSDGAMMIEENFDFSGKTSGFAGKSAIVLNAIPGYSKDQFRNLMTHEMGHLKAIAWADSFFTFLGLVADGYYYNQKSSKAAGQAVVSKATDKRAKRDLEGKTKGQDTLHKSVPHLAWNDPKFREFLDKWQQVSLYSVERAESKANKQKASAELSAWALKNTVGGKKMSKEALRALQDQAFGKRYASAFMKEVDFEGSGAAEEIAEAYKLYKYPRRKEYVAALRKAGRGDAADYIEGLVGVIEEYDTKINQDKDVSDALKEGIASKRARASKGGGGRTAKGKQYVQVAPRKKKPGNDIIDE